ncbi:hypothetical protein ASPSYDRAFT_999231 [Aspergillus sydowii CBS 593.65]|uniref:Uncharacterized protein n=1 Tax=Aspergillus sydowii CBS 593.65 TaxID=1036612 RepID=A0A1L9TI32_9EURO|nr:uncharacterized protein ASPSYDRAFT_999231 [Aspergillus sydowii CBS 593.65]OJJ59088.1 hypothetical protein ASPSYDRAFT_999231 [Aspergillus sydowii CBS 593.65]
MAPGAFPESNTHEYIEIPLSYSAQETTPYQTQYREESTYQPPTATEPDTSPSLKKVVFGAVAFYSLLLLLCLTMAFLAQTYGPRRLILILIHP